MSMNKAEAMTVGEVARLAGVTVRTLHHYDEVGLVTPAGRTEAGYRSYGDDEVERLQEVLFFRELGFSLATVKEILMEPDYKRADALAQQRTLLAAQANRLLAMVDAVDRAIRAERTGMRLSKEEMLEVFGDFDPTAHEEEAKERWGESDAYKQSAQRTSRYTPVAIPRRTGCKSADGVPDDDPAAMDVAEEHRAHITKWFYDCPKSVHAGLGQMYITDQRFQDNIDKAGAGLAEYMSAAMSANAER